MPITHLISFYHRLVFFPLTACVCLPTSHPGLYFSSWPAKPQDLVKGLTRGSGSINVCGTGE